MEQYHMITRGDRVVAGISGGADSVCLFFVLLELREEMGFDFVAVHVNHGLRGESADRDEQFVQELCTKYDVPLEIFHINLESAAKKWKQSLEEAGRQARRKAYEETCGKYGCNKITLAHHQNDNAETLLLNLCRGSGLAGVGGIRPVNGAYLHPLLCMTRQEIEQYLTERGHTWCTDETNLETEYTRNKLRHLVIPVLEEQVNTQTVRHMNETMEQLREVQEYIGEQAEAAFRQSADLNMEGGSVLIRQEDFCVQLRVVQKIVVRRSLERVCGGLKDIGQSHVEAVLELFEKQVGRRRDLPCAVCAVRVYEGVLLQKKEEKKELFPPIELRIPGETQIPQTGWLVRCKIFPKRSDISGKDIPEKVYTKWFDYDIINRSLCFRTRQSGDTIVIDHAGHRQKLKAWFTNEKIPAGERDFQPLIADGSRIVWIPGYRMSSAYQISENTRRILQMEVILPEKGAAKNGSDAEGKDDPGTGTRCLPAEDSYRI